MIARLKQLGEIAEDLCWPSRDTAALRNGNSQTLASDGANINPSSGKIVLMTLQGSLILSLLILLTVSPVSAQKNKKTMTGSAARGAASGGMQVVPDLEQRLARFRRVQMPFNSAGLTARDKKMVAKLVDASPLSGRYLLAAE